MIANVIFYLFDFWTGIMSRIIGTILKPVLDLIFENILGVGNYMSTVNYFLDTYFYKGIRFARDVFINVTGFPVGLVAFFGAVLIFYFSGWLSFLVVKGILNLWGLFRSGRSIAKGIEE